MNQALVEKKIHFFQDIIQKTQLNIQKNKKLDILGISEVNACITVLNMLSIKLNENLDNLIKNTTENIINNLQNVNNELVNLLNIYRTKSEKYKDDNLEDKKLYFDNYTCDSDDYQTEYQKKFFKDQTPNNLTEERSKTIVNLYNFVIQVEKQLINYYYINDDDGVVMYPDINNSNLKTLNDNYENYLIVDVWIKNNYKVICFFNHIILLLGFSFKRYESKKYNQNKNN